VNQIPLLHSIAHERRFVACIILPRADGKTDKIPCNAAGVQIDGQDPNNWFTFDEAASIAQCAFAAQGEQYRTAVGVVIFEGGGLFCVDVDGALHDGQWSPLALDIVGRFPDAYVEISQSGVGLHVIGRCATDFPKHRVKRKGLQLEIYTRSRFILLTGTSAIGDVSTEHTAALVETIRAYLPEDLGESSDGWRDGPLAGYAGPTDDAELIQRALNSRSASSVFGGGASFADLWKGNDAALARAFLSSSGDVYDRSGADQALANHLAWWTGGHHERVLQLMQSSGLVRPKWEREGYLRATVSKACASIARRGEFYRPSGVPSGTVAPPPPPPPNGLLQTPDSTFNPAAPYEAAKTFVNAGIFPSLKCWQGEFYDYRNGIYGPLSHEAIRAALYPFVQASGHTPNRNNVSNIHDALKAAAHLQDSIQPPAWIDDPLRKIPGLIVCKNGMFDLDSGAQFPLTPNLFSLNALPVEYDPNARAPEWQRFLASVWGHDPQSIEALQEVCGLLLTPYTGFQKLFLICGPRRSGKGTILRVMRAVLGGTDNVASPTLGSLAGQFGLQPLIGKLAAFVGDVRLSPKVDQSVLVERLLSITGEDNISIPRKHTTDFDTKLTVRFVFSSNEVPRLADASGAAASRFIVLAMTESFYGREDLGLQDRLLAELPGILAWCVEGRRRLMQRGRFVQPESARQQIKHLEDLGAPVNVFLREMCRVAPGATVSVEAMFDAWRTWCARAHRDPGDSQAFGRDLHAAIPGLVVRRPRVDGERQRVYEGIGLQDGALFGVRA